MPPVKNSSTIKTTTSLSVVAIGASAGGLEAIQLLLKELPPDTGLAFVVLQHLDPSHISLLKDALVSSVSMPIHEMHHGMAISPNTIYVMPSGVEVEIVHNRLRLSKRSDLPGTLSLPINRFFQSLARNNSTRAIGIILSGLGSDGTEGLRSIKEFGGFTLAQLPITARYPSMPENAIKENVVDFQLSITDIAKEIIRLSLFFDNFDHNPKLFSKNEDYQEIKKILAVVNSNTGIDFRDYKVATIRRRIMRRMAVLNVKKLDAYLILIKKTKEEAKLLAADLLIHVTSFFRDKDSFDSLRSDVFPSLIQNRNSKKPIRIWVAGCSSGQEVYSIIISILEFLAEHSLDLPIQVFGSDISDEMIAKCRVGFYTAGQMHGLSELQIQKYFLKVEGGYKVSKAVRDLCIFVRHDLAKDPPYSRLDLICCRNVLIYFDQFLQNKILSTFHFCLNVPGFLFLGKTENITSNKGLFEIKKEHDKIFVKVNIPSKLSFRIKNEIRSVIPKNPPVISQGYFQLSKNIDSLLLAEYAPCGVVTNEQMDVLEYRGKTHEFLKQGTGSPENNILRMVDAKLLVEIETAIGVLKNLAPYYRKDNIVLSTGHEVQKCNLVAREITAFSSSNERQFLFLFEEGMASIKRSADQQSAGDAICEFLKSDRESSNLATTNGYLNVSDQNNQRLVDALASVNEELVSNNDDLQSLNEEMETAREELQSTNEELTTVNDELNLKNHELGIVNSDLLNLLKSIEIPIIILGLNREIRRFTPHARSIMQLIASDIGRSIDDIKLNISILDLNKQISEVIRTGKLFESEVQDKKHRWQRIQIRPYRNFSDSIDGVIISLFDINQLRAALHKAEWACEYANRIVESIQIPLLVLDSKLRVMSANRSFYDVFKVEKEETENKSLFQLGISQWSIRSLRISLGKMLASNTQFKNAEVEREFPSLGKRIMSLSAVSVKSEPDMPPMILLAIEDITHRKTIEYDRKNLLRLTEEAKQEAEKANRTKDVFLATLSHELRTPLTSLLLQTQILRRGKMDESRILHSINVIESAAKVQAQLIEDLLDISRIISGKLTMNKKIINFSELVTSVIHSLEGYASSRKIVLDCKIEDKAIHIFADEMRMKQVIWNLCNNAIKFSAKESKVKIELKIEADSAKLKFTDHGVGIDPDFIPKIFNRFFQSFIGMRNVLGGCS